MDKKILNEEKAYLKYVFEVIEQKQNTTKMKLKQNRSEINQLKSFFSENYYNIKANNDELASINLQIENLETQIVNLQKTDDKLTKQMHAPYFARFDFQRNTENAPTKYYIGLGHIQTQTSNLTATSNAATNNAIKTNGTNTENRLSDINSLENSDNEINLVYDWRADVCSLYYDDVLGKTSYTCDEGQVDGELSLKRQFKIENGELSYYVDSHIVISDDILKEELSKNASSKMQTIVSTIQKEQNTLIRADDFENMIVQGVAGSGKTSIAMHRVSYLLYKYRKSLKSEDILVLSPSEVFSDYLSEILPTLGEEQTFTTTFTEMSKRLLNEKFETREEMLERLMTNGKQKDFENIAIKSSFEFLEALKNFIQKDMCNLFVPKTLTFGTLTFSKEQISDIYFQRLKNIAIHKRIEVLAEWICDQFTIHPSFHDALQKRAKRILYNKFLTTDCLTIYNLFLSSQELPEVSNIGAYDVAAVMLIKENLFGLKNNYDAKYVIVDEMQDYTPCHFFLFEKIWRCPKLYLGDVYQSIDRTLTKEYLANLANIAKAKIKFLNKSYRSTMQISKFSQKIIGKHIANNINRNGEKVECLKTTNCAACIEEILNREQNKFGSIAILCKTQKEIKLLQKQSEELKKFKELKKDCTSKKIITTPILAKGVEFDCVIIPFANEENYQNELDRNLLYVSSTRALHKLFFVADKSPSQFLTKK